MMDHNSRPIEIMLVEDNPGDVRLAQEALKEGRVSNRLTVVMDGAEALSYLEKAQKDKRKFMPDLILLDINLPKKNGKEVLKAIKASPHLKHIPVVMLTTSDNEIDVLESYKQYASSYIVKPVELDKFINVVKNLTEYWLTIVKFSPGEEI